MRGKIGPTACKWANYSGGFNTHNYETWSRLLKLELTLTASHIQKQLSTSQPLLQIFQNINCPKRFPELRPMEATVVATVAEVAHVKVVATTEEYTIHRENSTKLITRIGKSWVKKIARLSSTHAKKGSKSSHTVIKKDLVDTKRQISELSSTLNEIKAYIPEVSGKPQGNNYSEANSGQEAPVSGDAGSSFGDRASKPTNTWIERPLDLQWIGLMMFIKFYLLIRLGGHKPTMMRIMKTS